MKAELDIDWEVHDSLAKRAEENRFDSTEEYCSIVLELVLDELKHETTGDEVEERMEDMRRR